MTGDVVDSVDVSVYTIPTDAPEADGTLSWDSTTMVLAEIGAGGTRGIGWTYGPRACATIITDTLAGIVRGRPALDVGGSFDAMVKAVRNASRPGPAGYAISALDIALWDLKARILDLPLHRLLGAVHDSVPVYGSGGFTSYDQRLLHDQLTGWTGQQRIPRVKIKIGESWGTEVARDLDRMRQARTIIGDDVELFVDANGGYGRKQAIRVMQAASDLDVRWFEEPVSSDDLDGLREVRDAVLPDVTAGEYGTTCTTSAGCAPQARSTASKPTSHGAAASPNGCASPRSPPPTACRSPATAGRTCTPTPPPPPRTCGTWSGSTTTSGSSHCSSTAHWTPPAAPSTRPGRARSRPHPAHRRRRTLPGQIA